MTPNVQPVLVSAPQIIAGSTERSVYVTVQ